jgi:hypothetical protein
MGLIKPRAGAQAQSLTVSNVKRKSLHTSDLETSDDVIEKTCGCATQYTILTIQRNTHRSQNTPVPSRPRIAQTSLSDPCTHHDIACMSMLRVHSTSSPPDEAAARRGGGDTS